LRQRIAVLPTFAAGRLGEFGVERLVHAVCGQAIHPIGRVQIQRAEIVKNELQKRGVDPRRLIVSGEAASAADEAAVEIEPAS